MTFIPKPQKPQVIEAFRFGAEALPPAAREAAKLAGAKSGDYVVVKGDEYVVVNGPTFERDHWPISLN